MISEADRAIAKSETTKRSSASSPSSTVFSIARAKRYWAGAGDTISFLNSVRLADVGSSKVISQRPVAVGVARVNSGVARSAFEA